MAQNPNFCLSSPDIWSEGHLSHTVSVKVELIVNDVGKMLQKDKSHKYCNSSSWQRSVSSPPQQQQTCQGVVYIPTSVTLTCCFIQYHHILYHSLRPSMPSHTPSAKQPILPSLPMIRPFPSHPDSHLYCGKQLHQATPHPSCPRYLGGGETPPMQCTINCWQLPHSTINTNCLPFCLCVS